jgi:hypothetical protein
MQYCNFMTQQGNIVDRHTILIVFKIGRRICYLNHLHTQESLYRPELWAIFFVHCFGVKWYLSFSCAVSHHTEFACMYVRRQYHGYDRLPTRRELQEPNNPKDVIGSHHGIYVNLLLVQPILS